MLGQQGDQLSPAKGPCGFALELPTYPPLAWAGRVEGHGTATVSLDSGGIESIRIAELPPLLGAEVTRALQRSRFASCGRRQVIVEYEFVIEGGESASRVTTVIFLGGNHFVIKVNPPKPMPD